MKYTVRIRTTLERGLDSNKRIISPIGLLCPFILATKNVAKRIQSVYQSSTKISPRLNYAPFRGALSVFRSVYGLHPLSGGVAQSVSRSGACLPPYIQRAVKRFNGSKSKASTKRPFRLMVFFVPFPVQAYPERGKTSAVTKGFPSSVAKIGIYLIIANFKVIFFKKNIKKVINH